MLCGIIVFRGYLDATARGQRIPRTPSLFRSNLTGFLAIHILNGSTVRVSNLRRLEARVKYYQRLTPAVPAPCLRPCAEIFDLFSISSHPPPIRKSTTLRS